MYMNEHNGEKGKFRVLTRISIRNIYNLFISLPFIISFKLLYFCSLRHVQEYKTIKIIGDISPTIHGSTES